MMLLPSQRRTSPPSSLRRRLGITPARPPPPSHICRRCASSATSPPTRAAFPPSPAMASPAPLADLDALSQQLAILSRTLARRRADLALMRAEVATVAVSLESAKHRVQTALRDESLLRSSSPAPATSSVERSLRGQLDAARAAVAAAKRRRDAALSRLSNVQDAPAPPSPPPLLPPPALLLTSPAPAPHSPPPPQQPRALAVLCALRESVASRSAFHTDHARVWRDVYTPNLVLVRGGWGVKDGEGGDSITSAGTSTTTTTTTASGTSSLVCVPGVVTERIFEGVTCFTPAPPAPALAKRPASAASSPLPVSPTAKSELIIDGCDGDPLPVSDELWAAVAPLYGALDVSVGADVASEACVMSLRDALHRILHLAGDSVAGSAPPRRRRADVDGALVEGSTGAHGARGISRGEALAPIDNRATQSDHGDDDGHKDVPEIVDDAAARTDEVETAMNGAATREDVNSGVDEETASSSKERAVAAVSSVISSEENSTDAMTTTSTSASANTSSPPPATTTRTTTPPPQTHKHPLRRSPRSPALRPEADSGGGVARLPPPKRTDDSSVLSDAQFARIVGDGVPIRYHGAEMHLLYSTNEHGMSLRTLFSKVQTAAPTLIAIRDTRGRAFGCYAAHAWKSSATRYYGSGETFVYGVEGEEGVGVFKWSRANSFFQFTSATFLAVGGGSGSHFALWVDEDLLMGTTFACSTFGSPPLTDWKGKGDGTSTTEFKVLCLEVWGFGSRGVRQ